MLCPLCDGQAEMENKIRLLPLIGLLSLMLLAEGCATVRKGASSVADGTGAVVEGVGSALTALAPKRQGDAADEEEIVRVIGIGST